MKKTFKTRRILKHSLSLLLSFVMMFSVLSINIISVSAAELGSLPTNAIPLTPQEWQTKKWTRENYSRTCYNKFTIPQDGYITLTVSKCIDDKGQMCNYDFSIRRPDNTYVWYHQVENENPFEEYCTYEIGLSAGTYFLELLPDYLYYTGSYDSEVSYKYAFTPSKYWEKEPSDSVSAANIIQLNSFYYGVYGESYGDSDFYKIKLNKGVTYRMFVKNAMQLDDSTSTIMQLYDPKGDVVSGINDAISLGYGKVRGEYKYYDFIATTSGWYCLEFENSGYTSGVKYAVKFQPVLVSASELKISLSESSYDYNGKIKTPTVTVKDSADKKLKNGTDYTVSYAKGRKAVGSYKVTIKFKGNYSGKKVLTFKINPPKTSVKKLTAAKKSLKVSINKKTTQVTGYEIQYSTSKKFTKSTTKTTTVKEAKTTSATIKKLKAKKTYYVRIRTYKVVKGKKYYSAWSKALKKKTK